MADGLVEFLRARLDEDERTAYAADDSLGKVNLDWVYRPEGELGGKVASARGADLIPDVLGGVGKHVAVHDPRRVLAEVDAKRQIVQAYEDAVAAFNDSGPALSSYDRLTGSVSSLRRTVEALARPYAGHPDYRADDWRP
ncbi:DUF6221 family protein [Streptomyces sp. NPDC046977]|uniref:DUF6221 family protein n=1 Tax=Streptomyces sp. NPDC046977 TaxID=3154703 RepID=UPI0033C0FC03